MGIGGNLCGIIQVKVKEGYKNRIKEWVPAWKECMRLTGWLDLSTGDSGRTVFSAKIQESTHIFLCDYQTLTGRVLLGEKETEVPVTSENARMLIDGSIYEILLIDDPMNRREHLEIYLKYTGGQDGERRIYG